ncbi:2,3-bisphosphoglycerate-independent phosphoglycerate mutase [Desulfosarcina sp. BuS5]|uniref:alkaline phosphatase family protein n=2 Tax=Desulfosarcina sp. BuS5 TaxID=933262 RepID=UPI000A56C1BB|nr:alkaline phosphatase family protein [Desulfosarcina sp. BuS5]WDN87326.1 2,3-bisphosphoglycerate-independent phosphoglycerate mutase [Desulfosarcina sp. BuS5]
MLYFIINRDLKGFCVISRYIMQKNISKKCILILLDGIGDRSYRQFNHQTPLQAARTPVLDSLSKNSANGLYHAALIGQALPSENAHLLMFGYDITDFPGRGALEALGAGIDISNDDVAILSHFVSLREFGRHLTVEDNKPEVTAEETSEFIKTVSAYETGHVKISFVPTGGIRGIIILSGDVAPYITDSDPFITGMNMISVAPWLNYGNDNFSLNAASALNKYLAWVYQRLKDHPANRMRTDKGKMPINGIVTQRSGRLKKITPFQVRYGLKGLSIASGLVYWGISTFVGMDIEKVTDTKDPADDMAKRLALAHKRIKDGYEFVHVHTKVADEAAHTKDPAAKKAAIEAIDAGIGLEIESIKNDPDILLVVTADHSTPSSGPLIHSGESVPVMFYGTGVRRDNVSEFNEISAAPGVLGNLRGKELIYMILNHLDRSKLHGIMDTPVDQPYWPGVCEPFDNSIKCKK